MSYNINNFDISTTVSAKGSDGTVQLSDGQGELKAANSVTISTFGDITANAFIGDGSQLTGIIGGGGGSVGTLQQVTNNGNTTTNTVEFQNPTTSLTASSNIIVTGNVTASKFLGDGGTLSNLASVAKTGAYSDLSGTPALAAVATSGAYSDLSGKPGLQTITETGATTNREVTISNNLVVTGNLSVTGNIVQANVENLVVEDPIIQLANNSVSDSADTGLLFVRPTSNLAIGYRGDEGEVMIGFSTSSALGTDLVPLDDDLCNVKVYGNVEATNYVLGNANLLSNIVNSDITPGTYGDATNVAQIVIDANRRISSISEVEVSVGTLQQVTDTGNTTSNTVQFTNTDTSLVTSGNVLINGAAEATPLSVKGDSSAIIGVESTDTLAGIVFRTSTTTSGPLAPAMGVTGDDIVFYPGAPAALAVTIDSDKDMTVVGNVTATNFSGDGGLLSNIKLQDVTDMGNTTSNTVQFTNTHTAFTTDLVSNVVVKLDQLSNVDFTGQTLAADHTLIYDGNDWINDYNIHNFVKVYNDTGSQLNKGQCVYVYDSHNNNVANVALADATDSTKMPAIGLIYENVTNGSEGVAVGYGKVQGVNTVGFSEGEIVYVSNVTPGSITNTKPTLNSDFIQNVGVVIKADSSNGVIFVTGVGRTNDIPNASSVTDKSIISNIYAQTTTDRFVKITPDNLRSNFQEISDTGNVTSNTVQFTNTETSLVTSGNITVSGNVTATEFLGDGGLLSNIKLQDVTDMGNTTSNTVQFTNTETSLVTSGNITVSGNVTASNIAISNPSGSSPTVSASNIITIDQEGLSYKFFKIESYTPSELAGIQVDNTITGGQSVIDIYPQSSSIDIHQNFSNGGAGPSVFTPYFSNLVINSGSHCVISCVTYESNCFVTFSEFT